MNQAIKFTRLFAMMLVSAAMLLSASDLFAQKKGKKTTKQKASIESVSAEKKKHEQAIRSTSAKLEAKRAEINRQLSALNSLNSDIEQNRARIESLTHESDSINAVLAVTADSVTLLTERVEELRRAYIRAMRRLQPYANASSSFSFIFSSDNFTTALQRVRYLRRFSDWRKKKTEAITREADSLARKQSRLEQLRHQSADLISRAGEQQRNLAANRDKAGKLVTTLRSDEAALRSVLQQHKKQAKALDDRLDRLIAEEQARIEREEKAAREKAAKEKAAKEKAEKEKAARDAKSKKGSAGEKKPVEPTPKPEKSPAPSPKGEPALTAAAEIGKLTGSFAENKGRLPFPVSGSYRIISNFGRQPHPSLPKVEIENSGIDIETTPGASARAVFEGKVSAIFKEEGYNSIVMVRHGKYITIYAGLDNIAVKTGDRVTAGQALGTVIKDPSRGTSVLHFEIRNERTKLNPRAWLR